MVVYGGDIDAALAEPVGNGTQLTFGEHQVSHHRRTSALGAKCNPTAECERGQNANVTDVHLEIASRKAEADHAIGLGETTSAKRLLDAAPVVGRSLRGARKRERSGGSDRSQEGGLANVSLCLHHLSPRC